MTGLSPHLWALLSALAVAASVPIAFVYVRHEVRVQRLRILDQFHRTLAKASRRAADGTGSHVAEGGPELENAAELRATSSFEYVREKYIEDLSAPAFPLDGADASTAPLARANAVDFLTRHRHWWKVRSSWRLLAAALPFILISTIGFYALLACTGATAFDDLVSKSWRPLLLVGGLNDDPAVVEGYLANVLTVGAVGFLGAYLFSLSLLCRAVATFDLSALTMVRVTVNLITGTAAVIIAYRAFPDISAITQGLFDGGAATAISTAPLPRSWLLAAFVFGLVPDLIVNFLISKVQDLTGAKITNTALLKLTKATSLEIIDGIDFFSRFRLQQANIFEVQNLAVANPIMLFVETPYGVYQCVDWVAQAQLCTAVGPERFLALRQYNIRTIFDLERALVSRHTTSQLRRLVGTLMFTTPPEPGAGAWKFWGLGGSRPTADAVGSDAFGQFVHDLLDETARDTHGQPLPEDPDRTLKHFGRILIDDLHVHRLRDVWLLLNNRLRDEHQGLPDTELT